MGSVRGWENVRGARLPASAIDALASLRREPGVSLAWEPERDRAWVEWSAGSDGPAIIRALRPVRGVEFFEDLDGDWHRFGHALPCWDVPPPDADALRLDRAIIPGALAIVPPPDDAVAAAELTLVPDDRPRRATAARGTIDDLARWADSAPTAWIEALEAACSGDTVLVRCRYPGKTPAWAGSVRFWGSDVLIPLGYRVEPDLNPQALVRALSLVAASDEHVVVFDLVGAEWIESAAFRRLTRAGCRLTLARLASARGGNS